MLLPNCDSSSGASAQCFGDRCLDVLISANAGVDHFPGAVDHDEVGCVWGLVRGHRLAVPIEDVLASQAIRRHVRLLLGRRRLLFTPTETNREA